MGIWYKKKIDLIIELPLLILEAKQSVERELLQLRILPTYKAGGKSATKTKTISEVACCCCLFT